MRVSYPNGLKNCGQLARDTWGDRAGHQIVAFFERTSPAGRSQRTVLDAAAWGADLLAHSPHITRAPLMPRKPLIWDDACPRPRAQEIK
jgi:hypothetical protein